MEPDLWARNNRISKSIKSANKAVGIIKEVGGHKIEDTGEIVDAWRDGRSRKRLKKRLISISLAVGNVAVIVGVIGFIWSSQHRNTSTPNILDLTAASQSTESASRPLDQISSADIAVNLARLGRFEEVYWLAEQAAEVEYLAELPQSADPIAEKPQIVNSTIRSRKDISTYITVEGDTVAAVAAKFSVSSDSIKWSNALSGDRVDAGKELVIPPVGLNGVVYEVKDGDNIDDLAKKYQVSKSKLISFNDVESGELPVGERIFLQDGKQPVVRAAVSSVAINRPLNNGAVAPGYTPLYGSNGYVYGHCTYYLATKAGAPNGLGNANTWDNRAESFGFTKSKSPVAGAFAQRDWGSYYGHVAYVEDVSADGTMIKYSDMNGVGGWNRVYHSDWVPASEFNWYLY